jgi:hypothetical protein
MVFPAPSVLSSFSDADPDEELNEPFAAEGVETEVEDAGFSRSSWPVFSLLVDVCSVAFTACDSELLSVIETATDLLWLCCSTETAVDLILAANASCPVAGSDAGNIGIWSGVVTVPAA